MSAWPVLSTEDEQAVCGNGVKWLVTPSDGDWTTRRMKTRSGMTAVLQHMLNIDS
jgi:hypothetical protein